MNADKTGTEPSNAATQQAASDMDAVNLLIGRAEALTGIVRTAWITLIIGCLYAWLTLAALRDIDLFQPARTLTLPVVATEISTDGFFLFAPILLLAAFVYFQLMLARLWECYGRLRRECTTKDGKNKGLPVDERVAPWFLTVLIPQEHRGFDLVSKSLAVFFCWIFPPLTIAALAHRYLRAHEQFLTFLHCVVLALSIIAAIMFYLHSRRSVRGEAFDLTKNYLAMSALILPTFAIVFSGALLLIEHRWPFPGDLRFLSPHAQLFRAPLSAKPSTWDEGYWQQVNERLAHLEYCQENPKDPTCSALGDRGAQGKRDWENLLSERNRLRDTIAGAQLGHVPASVVQTPASNVPHVPEDSCAAKGNLVATARDLRHGYLRQAFLVNANLHCTDLRHGDLRDVILAGAKLTLTKLQVADLTLAEMEGSRIWKARMENTELKGANLQDSELSETFLQGANLDQAKLQGARLDDVQMQGATLTNTELQGAYLNKVALDGASLSYPMLQGAVLTNMRIDKSVDFSTAKLAGAALKDLNLAEADVSQFQLAEAFGDGSVVLPDGFTRPGHWPVYSLSDEEFFGRWQAWRLACGWPAVSPGWALRSIEQEYPTREQAPASDRDGDKANANCPAESPVGKERAAEIARKAVKVHEAQRLENQ